MPPGSATATPTRTSRSAAAPRSSRPTSTSASGAKTTGPDQNAFITINGVDAVAAKRRRGEYWTASVPVGGEAGPNPITIGWKQTFGHDRRRQQPQGLHKGQGCSGSFDVAQQAFGATDDEDVTNSGPIDLVQVADGNGLFANSLVEGTTHNFTITVRVKGLENSSPDRPAGDPPQLEPELEADRPGRLRPGKRGERRQGRDRQRLPARGLHLARGNAMRPSQRRSDRLRQPRSPATAGRRSRARSRTGSTAGATTGTPTATAARSTSTTTSSPTTRGSCR